VSGLPSSATQPPSTSLLHAQRHVQASAAPEAASFKRVCVDRIDRFPMDGQSKVAKVEG
jgi:hypothetical protein